MWHKHYKGDLLYTCVLAEYFPEYFNCWEGRGVSGLALHFQAAWTMAVRAVHLLTIKQTSCENNERNESNYKMWHRVLVEDWGGALVYREEKSVPKAVWCFYRPILFTAWGFTQSSVHWTSTRNNLYRKMLDYKYFILAISFCKGKV